MNAIQKVNGMLLNEKKVFVGRFVPRKEREKELQDQLEKAKAAAEEDDEVLFVGGAGVSDDEEKAEGVSRTFLGGGGNVMTRQQVRELRERSAGRSHRPATAGSRRSSGYSLSASGGGGSRYSNTSSAFSSVCRSVDSYLSGTRPVAKA